MKFPFWKKYGGIVPFLVKGAPVMLAKSPFEKSCKCFQERLHNQKIRFELIFYYLRHKSLLVMIALSVSEFYLTQAINNLQKA